MKSTILVNYSVSLRAALAMSAIAMSASAQKVELPDRLLTPETPEQVVLSGAGQEWKARLAAPGVENPNRQNIELTGPDGRIYALPLAPHNGNQFLFEEVLDVAQDGGLLSVITRRNLVPQPLQGQPIEFDGCRREYRWWLFVTLPEVRKKGFEPGKPIDESRPLMILGSLQLESDNRPSRANGAEQADQVLVRMKTPRHIEVEVIAGGREDKRQDIEWDWDQLKMNGEIRATFGGLWQPYVDPERARREISSAVDRGDIGALVPFKVSRIFADLGGVDNARLRLAQFARSNAEVERCMELLLAKKALEDAERIALAAAEPERLRALVEEEKRKEEARRQKVKEMDAKADKLDLEMHQQALREREREQKQREEEIAE